MHITYRYHARFKKWDFYFLWCLLFLVFIVHYYFSLNQERWHFKAFLRNFFFFKIFAELERVIRNQERRGAWLAQSEEYVTIHLRVMTSSPTLSMEPTLKKMKRGIKEIGKGSLKDGRDLGQHRWASWGGCLRQERHKMRTGGNSPVTVAGQFRWSIGFKGEKSRRPSLEK